MNPLATRCVQHHMATGGTSDKAGPRRADCRARPSSFPGEPRWGIPGALFLLCALALLPACAPKVALEAPKEPITINLNVKIEHQIRVEVDRELEDLFAEEDELF